MLAALLLLQAAAAPPPDIEFEARVTAREVRVERKGEARLEVRGGDGGLVRVAAPAAEGRRRLRNVEIRVRAEARVADPAQNTPRAETPDPD